MNRFRFPAFGALLVLLSAADLRAQESVPAAPEEIFRYVLAAGTVTGAVVSTPEGVEIRRESYIRDSEGRVVDVRMRFPDGRAARVGGAVGREWLGYPEGGQVYRVYRPDGGLELEELRSGSSVISRRTYTYPEDSRSPSVVEEVRPGEGWKRRTEYGGRGLPVRETLSTAEGPETVTLYEWDDRDRPVGLRILEGRSERRVRFSYGEDGSETEERTDSTGALVLRILRNPDGSSVEERFDGGILFARTFRKDGRLTREEIYLDGRLVRVRTAP